MRACGRATCHTLRARALQVLELPDGVTCLYARMYCKSFAVSLPRALACSLLLGAQARSLCWHTAAGQDTAADFRTKKIGMMSPTPAWQCELRTATELSQSWAESLFIASRVGANRTVPATHARSRRTDSRNERVSAHALTSGRGSAKGTLD